MEWRSEGGHCLSVRWFLATSDQAVSGKCQAVCGLLSAPGCQTDHLETTNELVDQTTTDLGHSEDGRNITKCADVLQLARERPVPWVRVVTLSEILVVLHDEASSLHGLERNLDLLHVGDTVTDLDSETDLTVVRVVVIVVVGHEPLVDTEHTAGLQDAEDLAVDALEGRCVDGGLDGVDCIEGVVGERHLLVPVSEAQKLLRDESYHKVTLGELELVRQTLLLGIPSGTLNLVVVVVEANNVDAGELDNLSCRSSNTAPNIEDAHVVPQTHLMCEVVLVASNGLVERLSVGIATEVKALAPAILVQVSREVVVVPCKGGIFISALLIVYQYLLYRIVTSL
jgi:hypothetical protein